MEDLIGGDKTLDFSKPFMPESLARTASLDFLSPHEKRTLNQIRGHAYLCIFGLVEEFILPFVLDHARPYINGEDYRARAFLEFASEEAKHIHLFRRFREEFTAAFKTTCEVIGPPDAVGKHVLSHPALSVALLTLHIEWMTQRHFQDSVKDDAGLDPQFKSLLLHHWMEEHQHAQLDTLMVEAIADGMSPAEIEAGIAGYVALGGFLDEGLKQQTQFDLAALESGGGAHAERRRSRALHGRSAPGQSLDLYRLGHVAPEIPGNAGRIQPRQPAHDGRGRADLFAEMARAGGSGGPAGAPCRRRERT